MYQTSKATFSRPSDLLCIEDRWAALQLDNAVTYFGTIIENAAQEQVNVGGESSPKYASKYRMRDLLTAGFKLDSRDAGDDDEIGAVDGMVYDEVR